MTTREQATFGAGCFWGVEAFFREVGGVLDTRVGHALGVQGTAHPARVEVVQVDFDPAVVTYDALLDLFWTMHDPTSLDRQGEESGQSVRSSIFAHSERQAAQALASKARYDASNARQAVTYIYPFGPFELAGEEHQQYLQKHGKQACRVTRPLGKVIRPAATTSRGATA